MWPQPIGPSVTYWWPVRGTIAIELFSWVIEETMAHKKQNAFTNTAPYTKYLYQTSESFNDEQKCGCEQLKKELGALKEIVLKLEKILMILWKVILTGRCVLEMLWT